MDSLELFTCSNGTHVISCENVCMFYKNNSTPPTPNAFEFWSGIVLITLLLLLVLTSVCYILIATLVAEQNRRRITFQHLEETENNYADNEPTKKEQNCAVNLCVEIEESLQRSSSSE